MSKAFVGIVRVPPGYPLVGMYVGLYRGDRLDVGKVLSAYLEGPTHRITYMVLSGPSRGKKFSSSYLSGDVSTFKTERACRRHFAGQMRDQNWKAA